MATTHRLNSFPAWMSDPETLEILEALSSSEKSFSKESARFVGGCVRDSLVNRTVYDIDLATPLKPEEVINCFKKAKIKCIPTGIEHGTVTAVVNSMVFEITTLRKDVETDGRHAKVTFTDSWEEDAARRDFTMNALYCDVNGIVYDYFGGVKDLHQGVVKFIGTAEHRIKEDVLRILRFFRFYAHYGRGPADEEALNACSAFADKIPHLSKERVTYEFLRMLQAKQSPKSCKYMQETRVLEQILTGQVHIDRLKNLIMLEEDCDTGQDSIRRLAALTQGNTPLFRFSKAQKKQLDKLNGEDLIPADLSEVCLRKKVYDLGHDIVRDIILLSAANSAANSEEHKEDYKKCYQTATVCRLPKFQLMGEDVLTLGVSEGKQVGEALKQVETWWYGHDFTPGRSECLVYLKGVVRQMMRSK